MKLLLASWCLGMAALAAAPPDPDAFSNLPRTLLDDTRQVYRVSAWESREWTYALAGAALVIGTALTLDRPVNNSLTPASPNTSWGKAATWVSPLGSTPGVLGAVGIYVAGAAFRNPEVRATGTDAMVAIAIAEIGIVLPLKLLAGRARPNADMGPHSFKPFSGDVSFPSGHTTVSFALASVISAHADNAWVTCAAYGAAGLVGLARVQERSHFVSDVVAGGLIGTFVGRTVVSHNRALRAEGRSKLVVTFAPAVLDGGYGLSFSARF